MKANNIEFKIVRSDQLDFDARLQISRVFADRFSQWLIFFSKDKNKISKAFAHMFVLDQFYVAIFDNKIVGMAACTNGKSLSVKLNKNELKKYLGYLKGSLAALFLRKEFERYIENSYIETGSIEFVSTSIDFRGRGVATQIIKYIIENTPYTNYLIEEVADTNTAAMNLYNKFGFIEYKRITVSKRRAKKIGINNFIALKYSKSKQNNIEIIHKGSII